MNLLSHRANTTRIMNMKRSSLYKSCYNNKFHMYEKQNVLDNFIHSAHKGIVFFKRQREGIFNNLLKSVKAISNTFVITFDINLIRPCIHHQRYAKCDFLPTFQRLPKQFRNVNLESSV